MSGERFRCDLAVDDLTALSLLIVDYGNRCSPSVRKACERMARAAFWQDPGRAAINDSAALREIRQLLDERPDLKPAGAIRIVARRHACESDAPTVAKRLQKKLGPSKNRREIVEGRPGDAHGCASEGRRKA
ncbi:MAG: hypothetical protein ACREHV_05530 [Rhizomicrobium sp.]